MEPLFEPVTVGALTLPNRVLMAPLTRCRADEAHVPTGIMATYYGQRAGAGLVVAEATMVEEGHSAFGAREPGIYNDAQVAGWRRVTDAVHAEGGRIALQLWHGGRSCHSALGGKTPVGPSAVAIEGAVIHTPAGKVPYEVPRELAVEEIPALVDAFRQGARRAIEAGFDAVEIHGANGYILDQFMRTSANRRTDAYGGSVANRARLTLEVVDAVADEVGADRVGLRISPLNSYTDMHDDDPLALTTYVCAEVEKRHIAFLHVIRGDFLGKVPGDVLSIARAQYSGVLIANMAYGGEEAAAAVAGGSVDAVAFGTPFIANPDYVEKLRSGAPLKEADRTKHFTNGPEGYIDY